MAGHSHSANIAVRKGAQDKRRGKLFTKLTREIMVAAKIAGPDPDSNARLRTAITKARSNSVPKDNIDRAIARATGNVEGMDYEDVSFDGYGPGGTAIMVMCLTDNRNRTAAEVRHAFSKGNGNLGRTGCVNYLFNRKGIIFVTDSDEDIIIEAALDSGAEDVTDEGDGFEVVTTPEDFDACVSAMEGIGAKLQNAEVMQIPDSRVTVTGKEADQLVRLLELLDDCEDVQQVHHNADIPDDELARIQAN